METIGSIFNYIAAIVNDIGVFLDNIGTILLTILFIVFVSILIVPEFFVGLWNLEQERNNPTTGTNRMINGTATVVNWNDKSGRVSYDGESWKAVSKDIIKLEQGDKVIITHIDKMTLTIMKL